MLAAEYEIRAFKDLIEAWNNYLLTSFVTTMPLPLLLLHSQTGIKQ